MPADLFAVVQDYLTTFGTGQAPCTVAYSGGLDSACLLHLLARYARVHDLELHAVTVDHGLRPFHREAEVTASFCQALGIRQTLVALPPGLVERAKETGRSLAEMARVERYERLRLLASGGTVFLAHHRDDQAETVLLRLMRGSGLQGLAAMRPVADDLRRPLLAVSRVQLETYAGEHSVPVVEDPTNRSSRYFRNRLRHEVLPLLESVRAGSSASLARSAAVLGDQATAMDELLEDGLLPAIEESGHGLSVPLAALGLGPLRRARLHWLVARLQPRPPEARHILALERLLASRHGSVALSLAHGLTAWREYGTLHLRRGGEPPMEAAATALPEPGEIRWGTWHLCAQAAVAPKNVPERPSDEVWLSGKTAWPLLVRGWHRGDRMQPFGMAGTRLLSDLLGEARVPRLLRGTLPVVEDGNGRIVWVPGVRRSNCPAVLAGEQALRLTCREADPGR